MTTTEELIQRLTARCDRMETALQSTQEALQDLRQEYDNYRLTQHFDQFSERTLVEAIATAVTTEYKVTIKQLIGRDRQLKAGRRPMHQVKQEHELDSARIYFVSLVRFLTPMITYPHIKQSFKWVQTRHWSDAEELIEDVYQPGTSHNRPQWLHLLRKIAQQADLIGVDSSFIYSELNLIQ